MNRNAQTMASTRPNRVLMMLAAAWMAAAIAIGGVFTASPADASASDSTTSAVGDAQP